MTAAKRPLIIANCSGFFGDHPLAAERLLAGPDPFDVLTGDYLAELTMLILWKQRRRDPEAGYVGTFADQMAGVLATALGRGIRIVVNAGGLNPRGLRDRLHSIAADAGLEVSIAIVEGDDLSGKLGELAAAGVELRNLDTGEPLGERRDQVATANAYLGAFGIARALDAGADIVLTGRVTDAALVTGPAAWWHGWGPSDLDPLAASVVVGHVLECGTQATGGNYPFRDEITPGFPGYPMAEIAADGTSVITKQHGSPGAVTIGTVTAQLLYELAGPRYENPDVAARFDTIELSDLGPDRVGISGVRGEAPSGDLKVALNLEGGYRNAVGVVLTGLDIEAKAAEVTSLLLSELGGGEQFDELDVRLIRTDQPNSPTNEGATATLKISVKSTDVDLVGRRFSNAAVALTLASIPGFVTTAPPGPASAFGIYLPALVPGELVDHIVELDDGTRLDIAPPPRSPITSLDIEPRGIAPRGDENKATVSIPLGRLVGARSGDKGGNANVGFWARSPEVWAWMHAELDVDLLTTLLPEAAGLEIRRFELANLEALNFVIIGLLDEGVAATARPDPQAKGLGEYLRSRFVEVPTSLAEQFK
jgi:hypothetical protein